MTTFETALTQQNQRVLEAARALRQKNLAGGVPFLILSEDLPEGLAYREFPDGHIEIQEITENGAELRSKLVRELTRQEAVDIRLKHGLF
ncbi:hypothetical protein [Mucilaginibacter paludis]|uniref:Uncharacterized protein n=1 Tax=Mucilaginibacter paludis DSM 18603 TaxID=714943 RepID=H1XZ98_9SPHI|nr:hypothetical protein [Mucilaginibacter paludis]EHQ25586.1 hypothetical protein Mucpa_1426 [Mucilaginibacter paludis DSM 18603]